MYKRIAQIVCATGLKKIEFARRLGVSSPFISELCTGAKKPSERTIADICREFNVNETWLRTGEGDMFNPMPETQMDEIVKEFGLDDLDYRIIMGYLHLTESDRTVVKRLIQNIIDSNSVKSYMTDAEIEADVERYRRERYARRDANDMEVTSELTPSVSDVMSELAEVKRQNQEMKRQNQEMAQQNREVVRQNKELLTRLEILEKEEDEWEREYTKQNISPTRSHTQ